MKNFSKLLSAIAISEAAGAIGAIATAQSVKTWYATLAKPALNPPSWFFGPAWTTLFLLMSIALYLVWQNNWHVVRQLRMRTKKAWNPISERLWSGDWQKLNAIGIFAVQYILNIAWSFVFFGAERPDIAFFVLLALWFAIIHVIANFYRISRAAAWLLVPYLLWVTFAGYLNYAIWMLN